MIDPRALEKLIEGGLSVVSFRDGDTVSGRMICDAQVEPDGRVSFEPPRGTALGGYMEKTKSFVLSVLAEGKDYEAFTTLFLHFDTDYIPHSLKFDCVKGRKKDPGGLYRIERCTNAVIACKDVEVVKTAHSCRAFGTVAKARLLSDAPTLTAHVYRNELHRHLHVQECVRCGQLYTLSSDDASCVFCGGYLMPIDWRSYRN